jgi:hypothetical protein
MQEVQVTGEKLQQERELDRLREQLVIFVLDEMGKRVGTQQDVQLPAALAAAIDAEVGRAFERRLAAAELPDPAIFRERLFEAARLGGRDQIARDKQYDAVANRLAIVATGLEQLLAERGIAFDARRQATDEEVAALNIGRLPAGDASQPQHAQAMVDRDNNVAGLDAGWRGFVSRWKWWIVAGLAIAALGVVGGLWLRPNASEEAAQTPPLEVGPVTQPVEGDGGELPADGEAADLAADAAATSSTSSGGSAADSEAAASAEEAVAGPRDGPN